MTQVRDWYSEYKEKLFGTESCGRRHLQMLDYFDHAFADEDNERFQLANLRKARRLGVALGEETFTLWCDAWIASTLYRLGEYKKSREVLADAVLRARKPIYANTPQRLMVHAHLASNFVCTDPISYEQDIRNLCQFIIKESGDCEEHITQALMILCVINIEKKNRDEALADLNKLQHHVAAHEEGGQLASIQYFQAKLAMRDQDWNATIQQADEGLLVPDCASSFKKSFLLIRACALAALGEHRSARTLFRRGNEIRKDIPDADDFTFCTMYWQIMGETQLAINVRLGEQEEFKSKGLYWVQYKSALHLVQLYEELEDTRGANRWRRKSQRFLASLKNPNAVEAIHQPNVYP